MSSALLPADQTPSSTLSLAVPTVSPTSTIAAGHRRGMSTARLEKAGGADSEKAGAPALADGSALPLLGRLFPRSFVDVAFVCFSFAVLLVATTIPQGLGYGRFDTRAAACYDAKSYYKLDENRTMDDPFCRVFSYPYRLVEPILASRIIPWLACKSSSSLCVFFQALTAAATQISATSSGSGTSSGRRSSRGTGARSSGRRRTSSGACPRRSGGRRRCPTCTRSGCLG